METTNKIRDKAIEMYEIMLGQQTPSANNYRSSARQCALLAITQIQLSLLRVFNSKLVQNRSIALMQEYDYWTKVKLELITLDLNNYFKNKNNETDSNR